MLIDKIEPENNYDFIVLHPPGACAPQWGAGSVGHSLLYMAISGNCLRRVLAPDGRCFSWAAPAATHRNGGIVSSRRSRV